MIGQESVQKTAEAIAQALGCDVTIVDEHKMRVAGTGPYRDGVGLKVPAGSAFEEVIEERQTIVIDSPGNDPCCYRCSIKESCIETYEICCPIMRAGNVLGVIGIFAHDEEQKAFLKKRKKTYLDFLDRMAELIASREGEQRLYRDLAAQNLALDALIQNVSNGVICTDRRGRVTHINDKALKDLGLSGSSNDFEGRSLTEFWSGSLLMQSLETGVEFNHKVEVFENTNKRVELLSTVKLIYAPERHGANGHSGQKKTNRIERAVLTFSDFEKLERTAIRHREKNYDFSFDTLIGSSPALTAVKEKAKIVAMNDSTVMITGESGTGKELFARAIHNGSKRREYPFISINCSAIPESLLESELFGYEAGAFTGAAKKGKPGKLELANKGTFFLDEIGDMPLYLQAKLLRVIQEKSLTKVGGLDAVDLDIRFISATNKNLEEMIEKRMFREDLYYRLNVIPLRLPALVERKEDIPVLLDHFLKVYNERFGKSIECFDRESMDFMMEYSWPGNIRELVNLVEYGINFATGERISLSEIKDCFKKANPLQKKTLRAIVARLERETIRQYLDSYGWDEDGKQKAADALGISRATLFRKLSQE